jgi:menaquinol-cytochrome c reductase iron-sulfur subunit
MTTQPSPPLSGPPEHSPPRRGLLAGIAAVITGALITLTPLCAGVMFALDPIRRHRTKFRGATDEGFLPVTQLSELPASGEPVRFTIRADLLDAWNLFKDRTIGTVYLRNVGGNVIAFTDVCPHLGCKVNYQSADKDFHCPCHASTFDLDGKKLNKIPPRGLDTLDVKVDPNGRVWVKYQDFRGAIAEKIPI